MRFFASPMHHPGKENPSTQTSGRKSLPRFRLNILQRYILIVFCVLILPALGVTLFFSLQLESIWWQRVEENLNNGSASFTNKISAELYTLKTRAVELAGSPALAAVLDSPPGRNAAPKDDVNSRESNMLFDTFGFSILVLGPDFGVVQRFGNDSLEPQTLQSYLVRLSVYGFVNRVIPDETGIRLVSLVPLGRGGQTKGYLVLSRRFDRLGIESMRITSSHEITILGKTDGASLYSTLSNEYGEPQLGQDSPRIALPLDGKVVRQTINGQDYFAVYTLFPYPEGEGLVLEVAIRTDRLWAYDATQPLLFFMMLVIVLVILSSIMMTRSIISPIISLNWAVESMRRHVRNYGPLVTIPVRNNDEIGDLARAINELGTELRGSSEKIEEQRAQIIAYTQSLEERVRERTRELDEARIRAEIANKHKSRFLVNMNHELRTPLNSITGTTDLLRFGAYEKHEEIAQVLAVMADYLKDKGKPELQGQLEAFAQALSQDSNYPRILLGYLEQRLGHYDALDDTTQDLLAQTQLLAAEEERGMFRAYTTIKDAGDSLLSLIDEIINLSQIESGVIQITLRPVRIADLIQTCMAHAETYARSRGKFDVLEFHKTIEPEVPEFVMMDHQKIKQVLLNLLTNAVKYTERGFVNCRVDTVAREGVPQVRFSVKDSGIGIALKDRGVLFHEFGRSFEVREIEGTGLGLALSKRLVERHGGDMDFTSEAGKGSWFWFAVPLEMPRDQSRTGPAGSL